MIEVKKEFGLIKISVSGLNLVMTEQEAEQLVKKINCAVYDIPVIGE